VDAIELLEAQHVAIADLVEEVEACRTTPRLQRCLIDLADAIAVHVELEERIFNPAVRARRSEDILLELLEEHRAIKQLTVEISTMDVGDDAFEPRWEVLEEQLLAHFDDEERALFPRVRRVFSPEELRGLAERMEALAARLRAGGDPRRHLTDAFQASEAPPAH
jgi:iron-sulfur cluster repair protein YtfE (RIC family)